MTLPANIRVNIGAPFPALVKGSGPVSISKQNGIWTVGLNFAGLARGAVVPDPANAYVLVWNAVTGVFTLVLASAVGGSSIAPTSVNFAMSPYVPAAADQLLEVDTSGGAITINLAPFATRGGVALTIKDITGNADANPITVNANGADRVDTQASVLLDSKFVAEKFQPRKAGGYSIV